MTLWLDILQMLVAWILCGLGGCYLTVAVMDAGDRYFQWLEGGGLPDNDTLLTRQALLLGATWPPLPLLALFVLTATLLCLIAVSGCFYLGDRFVEWRQRRGPVT